MMAEVIKILLLCVFVNNAFSSKCYECHTENYRHCEGASFSKREICSREDDQCYSMIYHKEVATAAEQAFEEQGFKKGCVAKDKDCQSICKRYLNLGYKDCKITCCQGDQCNKDGFRQIELKNNKKKRSSNQFNHTSTKYNLNIFTILLVSVNSLLYLSMENS